MRITIFSALLLASATPALAQVPPPPADFHQDNRDDRHDRGDVRQDNQIRQDERQIDRDAANGQYRSQDGRDLRQDERRDGQDRRDFRDDQGRDDRDHRDLRQDDRQSFRDDRRGYGAGDGYARFRGPQFAYPRGYRYRYYGVGAFLPRVFFDTRYYIDPGYYRLPPAFAGTRWVRVGPDALLIRVYDGRVVRIIQGLFY